MAEGAFATGLMGVRLLVDLGGMDRYRAGDMSVAAGLCGVGVLCDRGREDLYESGQFAQGAAYFGLGVLRDEGRNDRYSARWLALGEIGDVTVASDLASLLADPAWNASDGAATALAKLGEAALAPVRALMAESEDPAVQARCRRVIESIEK